MKFVIMIMIVLVLIAEKELVIIPLVTLLIYSAKMVQIFSHPNLVIIKVDT